jgi:hypothetical protein
MKLQWFLQFARSLKRRNKDNAPIEIFVRHCHFSAISNHKVRLPSFSKEKAFDNLLWTIEGENVGLTILLDTFHPMESDHFVKRQSRYPVIEIAEGTETGSFLKLLETVMQRNFHPDTIVYFLEDDYLHMPGWVTVLREGLSLPGVDYATLYDHKDKYENSAYRDLQARILCSPSTHWRTTPSTTNTFAMRFKTLMRDLEIHKAYSQNRKITEDHAKFCALWDRGAVLISSIPGWSTHAETEFASPCVPWEQLLTQKNEEVWL